MAATVRYTGKDMRITWNTTDVSGEFRVLEVEEGLRTVDATSGDDSHEQKLADVLYGRANMTVLGLPGTAGSAVYNALVPGTAEGTLIYYPQGTVPGTPSGNQKYTFLQARIISRTHRMVYNAAIEIRVGFEMSDVEVPAAVA